MNKKTAFTLAEVLITLTIIGIVAALTIPTLINNYQKKQYVTSLKKFYSTFNEALTELAVDRGCTGNLACTGLFVTGATPLSVGEELVKYFKVAKNCKDEVNLGCMPTDTLHNWDGSDPSNTENWDASTDAYKFTTLDGASIVFQPYDSCSTSISANITDHMTQVCGEVYVDVNGIKKPNIIGRDTFGFWLTNGKGPLIYPVSGLDEAGAPWNDPGVNVCSPTSLDGMGCTARIIEEGWEMNY